MLWWFFTPTGERLDGFRIGLVHHPLSYFADEQDARTMMRDSIDLLLRGLSEREHRHTHDAARTPRQIPPTTS